MMIIVAVRSVAVSFIVELRQEEAKEEYLPPCVLFFTSGTSSSEEDMRFTGMTTRWEDEFSTQGTDKT